MDISLPHAIGVGNLARALRVTLFALQRAMDRAGLAINSSNHVLTADEASLVALELGFNPVAQSESTLDLYARPLPDSKEHLPIRAPVVTIMGHVDHGKTTLLDNLRKSAVAKGEAGGITQHIGAFSVPMSSGQRITFLDTPGHAAFSQMRSRGARVTDLVVLVVAADDGVMPQTIEAYQMAKSAQVALCIALNKVDKIGVEIERAKNSIARMGVQLEEYGGDTPLVQLSGLTGAGTEDLVETIGALAEQLDLRTEIEGPAEGFVIESNIAKGQGMMATVLIRRGTLRVGDEIVAGTASGRVRRMVNDQGKVVKEAGPSVPVTILGWRNLPSAGDELLQAPSEAVAKTVVRNRLNRIEQVKQLGDLSSINEKRKEKEEEKEALASEENATAILSSEPLELLLIIKGDVSGTVEALMDALSGLGTPKIKPKIVGSGVGPITSSDIDLAQATGAEIIAFNVVSPKKIRDQASGLDIEITEDSVIYRILDRCKEKMRKRLPRIVETRVIAEANILDTFAIRLKGRKTTPVAGCRVVNGSLKPGQQVRVVRNKEVIHTGTIESLRHHKDEVEEIKKGNECGVGLGAFKDFQAGDDLQAFTNVEKEQSL